MFTNLKDIDEIIDSNNSNKPIDTDKFDIEIEKATLEILSIINKENKAIKSFNEVRALELQEHIKNEEYNRRLVEEEAIRLWERSNRRKSSNGWTSDYKSKNKSKNNNNNHTNTLATNLSNKNNILQYCTRQPFQPQQTQEPIIQAELKQRSRAQNQLVKNLHNQQSQIADKQQPQNQKSQKKELQLKKEYEKLSSKYSKLSSFNRAMLELPYHNLIKNTFIDPIIRERIRQLHDEQCKKEEELIKERSDPQKNVGDFDNHAINEMIDLVAHQQKILCKFGFQRYTIDIEQVKPIILQSLFPTTTTTTTTNSNQK